jgi:hypothetical protein
MVKRVRDEIKNAWEWEVGRKEQSENNEKNKK